MLPDLWLPVAGQALAWQAALAAGTFSGAMSLGGISLTSAGGATRPEVALCPNPAQATAPAKRHANTGAATATLTVLDAQARPMRTQTAVANPNTGLGLHGLGPSSALCAWRAATPPAG